MPIRLRKVWNDDLAHRDPALKPLKATTHADPGLRKVWNDDLAHRDPALKPLRAITHADPGLRELVGGGRMDYHGAEPPFPAPTLAPRSQNRSPVHSLTTLPHHGPRASSRAGAIGCAPRAHFLARSSSRASGRGREGGGVGGRSGLASSPRDKVAHALCAATARPRACCQAVVSCCRRRRPPTRE